MIMKVSVHWDIETVYSVESEVTFQKNICPPSSCLKSTPRKKQAIDVGWISTYYTTLVLNILFFSEINVFPVFIAYVWKPISFQYL
jgi:hypothetical protein